MSNWSGLGIFGQLSLSFKIPSPSRMSAVMKARSRPSAEISVLSAARAMDAGADDFLRKPLDRDELAARVRVAERILGLYSEVKELESLLPICSYCRKIRDASDRWHDIEAYISNCTETSFTHGICPECYESRIEPQLRQFDNIKS